jgi:DMSO/TMAO reductase YedYZ molybdopterin-dependent catalytic subunit
MPTSSSRRAVLRAGVLLVSGAAFAGCRRSGAQWPDPPPFLTPQDRFYNRLAAKVADGKFVAAKDVPKEPDPPDPSAWRLAFRGFDTEATIDAAGLADLARRHPPVSFVKTLRCTGDGRGNRLQSTGVWTGIPLLAVMTELGVPEATRRLRVTGHDGFTANLQSRFTNGMDGRPALLATHLNGEPLLPARGGPCRLLIPDRFGFKNVKWPTEILASPADEAWGDHEVETNQGEDDGLITFVTKILSPDVVYEQEVQGGRAGPVILQGIACGGLAPIQEVRLRVDGGPWRAVEMIRPAALDARVVRQAPGLILTGWPMTDVAVPWRMRLDLPRGTTRIEVMATNTLGEEQPKEDTWRVNGDSSWAFVELDLS